jgi:SAP domain
MSYYEFTYRELQVELKKRELKASGKKDDLIERLRESDNNGYIDHDMMDVDDDMDRTSKLFHVRTMVGVWHEKRLQNNQTIEDLLNSINESTGIPIDQIRLSTQEGVTLEPDCPVDAFDYSKIYLNMTIRLRTRRR